MQHVQTLIVEDSRLDAKVISGLMGKSTLFEFDSETVDSGSAAKEYVKRQQVDLMLLDLGLPDSTGENTLNNFKSIMAEAPVIVLTGDDDIGLAMTALRQGAQDYLVKGRIDLPMLEKSVRYAMERHRMHLERTRGELSLRAEIERSNQMLKALDRANEQLEKEIARSRLFTTAIEQSVETVVITDTRGTILYTNKSFETVTGYTASEAIGKNPRILKSGLHDATFYRNMWDTLTASGAWFGRLTNRKKDGTVFEEEARLSSVKDENGVVTNYVAVKRDVSHEAALEMQLMQARKLESIGQLAAGIAHEINTPSQYVGDNIRFLEEAIGGFVTVIGKYEEVSRELHSDLKSSKLYRALTAIKEELDMDFLLEEAPGATRQALEGIERITKIVLAMKEFAHPGTEQMTMTDINKSLLSTVTVASNEWKYVASLETELMDSLPMVPCYTGEMNQVFLNIIVNAAHAIDEANRDAGFITVKTCVAEPYVCVDISDNGSGIPAKIREKIFDPFFTTKEVGKGTGQGLAMAFNTVVDRHHGQLRVNSKEGEGSTFTILLPLEQGGNDDD